MIEKLKGSLGLAAIIIGIGIAWVIIGNFIKNDIGSGKMVINKVYFEIEISDIKNSERFYSGLFGKKILANSLIQIKHTTVKLVKTGPEKINRSKMVLKIENYKEIIKKLSNDFYFENPDSLAKIFDPDSNLIILKPALQF